MPQFFLNKRLILLLVSIIVLVALIGFSLKEDRKLSWPEQFLQDTVGVFQSIFHKPAIYVSDFFENVTDLKNTYEENELLKSRLDEYMQLEADLQEYKEENERLLAELGKVANLRKYNPIFSTVIGRNPDRWYDYVSIDKGAQDGIQPDMAVVTAEGLVGKVKTISQFTSTVQLLSATDLKNKISAEVQALPENEDDKNNPNNTQKVMGLIEGYDEEKGALLLKRIESDVKLVEGQKVITSGKGEVFPEGILIGEIIGVEPDTYGLEQMAYVKPSANFYDIDRVWVAERVAQSEDPVEAVNEEEEES
ncbi:rod shape-determining protein MreC [Bacillus sp. SA1-12]|uniref:rod shape-determining protein MreC n=1 Tax=Bacillus sp. SA1-12 TaxID=1455638 RepID=UPI000626D7AD|nr:rod shape-determining protein MreC [Bacillus sp. SA1-12]KKI92305.1 rod shape-determining protein MreC [Bacillus sp. SA1-12]